jgi:hypothetical protein
MESSLRAAKPRGNPERAVTALDCFAPLAMTKWAIQSHQNPEGHVFDPRHPVIVRSELVEAPFFRRQRRKK